MRPQSAPVTLLAIGANGCHWPTSGHGISTLFCGADRSNSGHVSYCRWHFRMSTMRERDHERDNDEHGHNEIDRASASIHLNSRMQRRDRAE